MHNTSKSKKRKQNLKGRNNLLHSVDNAHANIYLVFFFSLQDCLGNIYYHSCNFCIENNARDIYKLKTKFLTSLLVKDM